jgi:hypothetical protein
MMMATSVRTGIMPAVARRSERGSGLRLVLSIVILSVLLSLQVPVWKQIGSSSSIIVIENHPRVVGNDTTATTMASAAAALHNNNKPSSPSHNNNNKPYLIYHIGPPKTGTTTIQDTLRSFRNTTLLQDNIVYDDPAVNATLIDLLLDLALNNDCHKQLATMHQENNNSTIKKDVREIPYCWRKQTASLRHYRAQNKSILVSAEPISYRKLGFANRWGLLAKLLQDEWNVIILIGYRRYYEWITSAKEHQQKWRKEKRQLNIWNGVRLKPLHPKFTKPKLPKGVGPNQIPFYFTDTVIKAWSENTIRIVNLNDEKSLPSTFVCDVLPHAKHTCQAVMDLEKQSQVERISNAGKTPYYEVLAMLAADMNWMNTSRISRHDFVLTMQEHNENTLNQTWRDFEVVCPSRAEMEAFLNISLAKERAVLPAFAKDHEEELRAKFWQAVELKKFCWIDALRVLQKEPWRDFLSQWT